ncbi:MAG: hypothetical protein ABIG90_01385 [bacterium]
MHNLTCPGCFTEAGECFWRDIGELERFLDEYTLYCNNCGYVEKTEKDGGWEYYDNTEISTTCKYCGEAFHKHSPPPIELCFFI